MNQDKTKDRVRGSIIGGAIGDALGYPVEFIYSFEGIQKRYGENGITRLDTYQWWTETNTGKAVISDDTQMTLFTAMGILNAKANGIAPIPSICRAYIEWLYTQKGFHSKQSNKSWISDLPELNVRRAPGLTCISALETILKGKEPINNSKGCGGIMRIAPIPLYGLSQNRISNIALLNELAADAAEITHQHPLGYIPAYITSHIIYRLATDEAPTCEVFVRYVYEALQQATEKYSCLKNEMDVMQTLVDKALVLASENIPDHVAIKEIGEGWVAEETLAIAIYCAGKHFDNFEKALIASVNHGGDSDSTGAVTGNILGAAVGYEAIPQYIKNDLELHDVILHVADDLWLGKITQM